MRLTLPYPPSVNAYWRAFKGRILLSRDGRAYKTAAALVAKTQGARILAGPVLVRVDVYRPRRIGDLDNTLKATLDALRGIAFEDDAQVESLSAIRHDDKKNPRVEVEVLPFEEVLP